MNVSSGVRLSRIYLPKMLEPEIGVGSCSFPANRHSTLPGEMIHYGVTKTAQLALARGLAETTAGTNVTVNSVLPGPTRSEGVEKFVRTWRSPKERTTPAWRTSSSVPSAPHRCSNVRDAGRSGRDGRLCFEPLARRPPTELLFASTGAWFDRSLERHGPRH